MRRFLSLPLFAAALCLAAEEPPLSLEALSGPVEALGGAKDRLALAAQLLEAGEAAAVRQYIERVSDDQPDLANKLRALVETAEGNPAGAVQALENVVREDAWTSAEKKRAALLLAQSAASVQQKSEHFRLVLPQRDAFLGARALAALESAREKGQAFYGVALSSPIRAAVHADAAAFAAATGVSADDVERTGRACVLRLGRIHLLSPRAVPDGFRWLDALAAGYNRLLIDHVTGRRAPEWVREGLSRWQETAWRREGDFAPDAADVNRLARLALSTGAAPTPALLDGVLAGRSSADELLSARVQAADAVAHLVKTHGAAKVAALLAAFRRAARPAAFSAAFGDGEEDLWSAWRSSLGTRSWAVSKGALEARVSFKASDPVPGPEAAAAFKAGETARAAKAWGQALSQYKKALAAEPDNGWILWRAAQAALVLEDEASADAWGRRAMEKNPSFVPPFVLVGRILFDAGRYDEAQSVLQEGLEIQPCHPRLHETLGYISMDVADVAAARRSFLLSLEFDPQNADVRQALREMPAGKR